MNDDISTEKPSANKWTRFDSASPYRYTLLDKIFEGYPSAHEFFRHTDHQLEVMFNEKLFRPARRFPQQLEFAQFLFERIKIFSSGQFHFRDEYKTAVEARCPTHHAEKNTQFRIRRISPFLLPEIQARPSNPRMFLYVRRQ